MDDAKGAGGQLVLLRDQLLSNGPGKFADLIWDETFDLKADAAQMDIFLGAARHELCVENIFRGLGIPAHLLKPETRP